MATIVLLLFPFATAQAPVCVDIPSTLSYQQLANSTVLYQFSAFSQADILLLITCFDLSLPRLYLSARPNTTVEQHTWEGRQWGQDAVVLLTNVTEVGARYSALVICEEHCVYNISFADMSWENELSDGEYRTGHAASGEVIGLSFYPSNREDRQNEVDNFTFTVTSYGFGAQFQVLIRANYWYSSPIYLPVEQEGPNGYRCAVAGLRPGAKYKLLVRAISDLNYATSVLRPQQLVILKEAMVIRGTAQGFTYYEISRTSFGRNRAILLQITAFEGKLSVYMQFESLPTLTNFYFIANVDNNNTIKLPISSNPYFNHLYIGLYSPTPSVYSLYCRAQPSSSVPLYPYLPQSGSTDSSFSSYYEVSIPAEQCSYVTFHIVSEGGDANMYVKECSESACWLDEDVYSSPQSFNVYYAKGTLTDKYVTIPVNSETCPSPICQFSLSVTSNNPAISAKFTLLVTYSDVASYYTLNRDNPVRMTLEKGDFYYQYQSFDLDLDTISFRFTRITGESSLFTSRNAVFPSIFDYEKTNISKNGSIEEVITY